MYGVGQIAQGVLKTVVVIPATINTAQSQIAFQHGHFLNQVLVARAQNKSLRDLKDLRRVRSIHTRACECDRLLHTPCLRQTGCHTTVALFS